MTGVSGHIAFDEIGDATRDSAYIKTANTANRRLGFRDGADRWNNPSTFPAPAREHPHTSVFPGRRGGADAPSYAAEMLCRLETSAGRRGSRDFP